MRAVFSEFPDVQTLTLGLTSVFNGDGPKHGQVTILYREQNTYTSYQPNEIVTCEFDDGTKLRLLVKYGVRTNQRDHGHMIGPEYESAVYRQILQPLQTSTPIFYGSYTDTTTGVMWLILEYLYKGVHAHDGSAQSVAMGLAARWIGQFHAANETRLSIASMPFLNIYDAEYYLGWARRTLLFEGDNDRQERHSWLPLLCQQYEEEVDFLLSQPTTIIHGDYYPDNILLRHGIIHPIDWEQAAIAAGEIDLASLTNDWHAKVVQECELEYQRARWPAGAPADFGRTLGAARLYVLFRLLGEAPDWPDDETRQWQFELLRSAGEQLGLI